VLQKYIVIFLKYLLRIYKVDVRHIYYASVGTAASHFDGNINQDVFL